MKKFLGAMLVILAVLIVASALIPKKDKPDAYALESFGSLPVLEGGRLKPLDTVARNTLFFMRGKQNALNAEGNRVSALQFMADLGLNPEKAADYKVFRVDDPDVLGILGSSGKDVVHFSYNELRPHFDEIDRQAKLAPDEAAKRSRYQRSVLRLREALMLYQRLDYSFVAPVESFGPSTAAVYERFAELAPVGMQSIAAKDPTVIDQPESLREFLAIADRFRQADVDRPLSLVPPTDSNKSMAGWKSIATATLDVLRTHQLDPIALGYARLADARRAGNVTEFNHQLELLHGNLDKRYEHHEQRVAFEVFFNHFEPFYISTILYVFVLLIACISWLIMGPELRKAAFYVLILAVVVHTFGLFARIIITGYAPVTNLYSSAVFIGWAAVIFCIILEAIYKDSIGSIAAGIIGVATLIVAHNLAVSGGNDTMEMMRAVLDSNFWLSTHVTTVTLGYAATFLAGILAMLYLVLGMLTKKLTTTLANDLERMIYGILCFALLFSFVGTVLGGIWADQSWGRFWGWDPKENGALMIVIWNALVLHAKRIRMAGQRGVVLLALFGNIITSWSWFGTNMLGIGLHSYGFMDSVFAWLLAFWLLMGAMIAIGKLDARFWRSGNALLPAWNRGKNQP